MNGAAAIGGVLMVAMAAAAVAQPLARESLGASAAAEFAAMLRHRNYVEPLDVDHVISLRNWAYGQPRG